MRLVYIAAHWSPHNNKNNDNRAPAKTTEVAEGKSEVKLPSFSGFQPQWFQGNCKRWNGIEYETEYAMEFVWRNIEKRCHDKSDMLHGYM